MVFATFSQASPPYRDRLCPGPLFTTRLFSRSADPGESMNLSLLYLRETNCTARAHEHANSDQARGKSEQ